MKIKLAYEQREEATRIEDMINEGKLTLEEIIYEAIFYRDKFEAIKELVE